MKKKTLIFTGILLAASLTACGSSEEKPPLDLSGVQEFESSEAPIDLDKIDGELIQETPDLSETQGENTSSESGEGSTSPEGSDANGKEAEAIRAEFEVLPDEITDIVVSNLVSAKRATIEYGTVTHFEYESKTCGCTRGANVLLPAGYDESREYPVLYFLHGIFGDENSMIGDNNNKIPQIVGNLAADGYIEDIIVIFPDMYATDDPNLAPGFTAEATAPYDNFINDLENDLIPYVEANYSVATDRMKRGIIGFSMGGREALFIGVTRSDLFAYIGAISPAPGVTPAKDWAMEHPGQLAEDELVIAKPDYMPELLMICCGTKDNVVGTFPLSYHEIMTNNGVDHLWYEIPDADHDNNAIKSGLFNYLIRSFAPKGDN